jgi:anti-sigma regulatory factor (Ser/Thr protein kinase)
MLLERFSAAGGSVADARPQVLELALPAHPSSCRQARRALAAYGAERGLETGLLDAGVLALSELVTNAVLHAETPFMVWAESDNGHLTLAVLDGNSAPPSLLPLDEGEREGGRGVAIINELGATWGMVRTSLGKVVWVDIGPT